MLLTELVNILRVQYLDDVAEPYLWGDPEVVSYIIQSEAEACERAHLIIDDTTPAICLLPIQVGLAKYSLDEKVLLIKRVLYGSSGTSSYELKQRTRSRLDEESPGWQNRSGTPWAFICEDNGEFTIVPPPIGTAGTDGVLSTSGTAGTAFLQVSRLPVNTLTLNSTAGSGTAGLGITYPEIPSQYHMRMLYWAAHLAFLKNDSETFNLAKADKYEALFERYFGKPVSAKTQRFMRSHDLNHPRMRPRPFGG